MPGRVIFSAASLLCATAAVLDVIGGKSGTLVYVVDAEVLALIGLLLTERRPDNRVSWIFAVSALGLAAANLCSAYAVVALVEHPGFLPGGMAAAWVDNWAWVPGLVLPLCALLLLVPDGHLPSARWRPAVAALILGTVASVLAVSESPTFDLGTGTPIDNPLALDSWLVGVSGVAGLALVLAGVVASFFAFVIRFRQATGDERQQLRWVGLSLVVAALLAIVGVALWSRLPSGAFLPALSVIAYSAGISVAVLRYRLYEIDRVVSKTLVYASLTLVLGAAYVVLVLAGQALFSSFAGGSDLAIAVSTLVVAALFLPLRGRIQRVVDRRFYRRRYDAQRTLHVFGARLREEVDLETLAAELRGVVGETMQPSHASLWLRGKR